MYKFRPKKLFAAVLVLFTKSAFASQASSHEINWWSLGGEFSDRPAMGWLIITFIIFTWALMAAVRKPLALYLETRSNDIKKAIEEGQKAKLESEQKLKVYEEKLASLDSEIAKIKNAFAEQAQAERAEKERAAKETCARILKDAEDTIRANFERSKNRLAQEVIESALSKAQNLIAQNQLEKVDEHLKESLIADLRNQANEHLKPSVVPVRKTLVEEVRL